MRQYKVRKTVNDPIRGHVVNHDSVYGELMSGFLDRCGREIYEGDRITFGVKHNGEVTRLTTAVSFEDGAFWVDGLDGQLLSEFVDSHSDIEIVGHVGDLK